LNFLHGRVSLPTILLAYSFKDHKHNHEDFCSFESEVGQWEKRKEECMVLISEPKSVICSRDFSLSSHAS